MSTSEPTTSSSVNNELTEEQKTRIEENRQKALKRRAERAKKRSAPDEQHDLAKKAAPSEFDDDDEFELTDEQIAACLKDDILSQTGASICEECSKPFHESYLLEHFSCLVCDSCRDRKEKHRLISRTEAKERYLLKDHDFDKREPVLQYILKRNPHKSTWGDMKLYLEIQVAERAMLVWETEENLESEKEKRLVNREKMRQKKFVKRMKDLRMTVRSSLSKKLSAQHEHEYGEENYNEDDDMYSKTCKTCGHCLTYEKM